jgi:Transglycosylase-like domain
MLHARRSSPSRGFEPRRRRGAVPGGRVPDERDPHPILPVGASLSAGGRLADDPFLVCTRGFESIYAGGYTAVSPGGRYRGAYQFDQVTWNGTARHLERFDLVGVRADEAPPAVQDLLAFTLYKWQGAGHWHGRCAGLP